MAGCSGKGRSVISVAVTGAPSTVTAGGAPVTLTAMVSNDSTNAGVTCDLTGVFCTSRGEREFTRRTAGNAQQEVQSGTDRNVAAAD